MSVLRRHRLRLESQRALNFFASVCLPSLHSGDYRQATVRLSAMAFQRQRLFKGAPVAERADFVLHTLAQ
jgi:hypothetical protein